MKLTLLTLVVFATTLVAEDSFELPPAPSEFTWKSVDSINSHFLFPDGWHYSERTNENSRGIAFSKENVEKTGIFETGFTIQVIKGLKEKTGVSPLLFGVERGIEITERPENTVAFTEEKSVGPLKGFVYHMNSRPKIAKAITVYSLYLANDAKDTLWIFTFESPESEWGQSDGVRVLLVNFE